jgi:hypothetical protein
MRITPRFRISRATLAAFSALLVLTVMATLPRTVPVRADDGCDTSEPVACIPLPVEEAGPGTAPTPLAGAPAPEAAAPSVAAPVPPAKPCPPVIRPNPDVAVAMPLPVPPGCIAFRAVVATVNRANVLYARTVRTLDTSGLSEAWGGDAIADLVGQVAGLRASGQFATPQLLSISLREIGQDGTTAHVRTIEHWLYQQRLLDTGEVTIEQDQWVQNVYTLTFDGTAWLVTGDTVTLTEPPAPAPVVSVRVTTDRSTYAAGDDVLGTITNDGTVAVYGGGGYACGLLRIEVLGDNGWQPARLPEPLIACPAIARAIPPGGTATQTLPAGRQPGTYRLVFRYSFDLNRGTAWVPQPPPDGGSAPAAPAGTGAAYSDPYVVQ